MLNVKKNLTKIMENMNDIIVLKDYLIPATSFNTYYGVLSKDVTLAGYTPIALTIASINLASCGIYRIGISGNTVEIGVSKFSQSGTLTSLTATFTVAYVRTDLIG